MFYTCTGLHGLHVLVGLVLLSYLSVLIFLVGLNVVGFGFLEGVMWY